MNSSTPTTTLTIPFKTSTLGLQLRSITSNPHAFPSSIARVNGVVEGGEGDKGGVRVGDFLVEVGGFEGKDCGKG